MKIVDAKKRVRYLRFAAIVIIITSALLLLFGFLAGAYFLLGGDTTRFSGISNTLQRAIYFVYERTQFLSYIWDVAPVPNLNKLNSLGNLGFLFILCCGWLGRIMLDSASHLASRITKTIQRVDEIGWEQNLMAQQGKVVGSKPDVLQINIELDQKDQWYKRPSGLLLIGIAIAVLAQWANIKFGLVK